MTSSAVVGTGSDDQVTTKDLLYVVYMFSTGLFFQEFEAHSIERRSPQRDTDNCPESAYGFYYAYGPPEPKKISQLKIDSGMHFVDAIIIPTARLADYCEQTGAYHDVEELIRNGESSYHAHTRDGRFFGFDMNKDEAMATSTVE